LLVGRALLMIGRVRSAQPLSIHPIRTPSTQIKDTTAREQFLDNLDSPRLLFFILMIDRFLTMGADI